MTADELNKIFSIRDLWHKLNIPGQPPRPGQTISSPFREDKHPSFSIHGDGYRAHDFGTGQDFSAIDFFGASRQIPTEQQIPEYVAWLAQLGVLTRSAQPPQTPALAEVESLPAPTPEQCRQIASVRHLDVAAIDLAAKWGVLKIGVLFGYPSWILTDRSKLAAEGRRLDGEPYPAFGTLSERKAHSIRGTKKDWPVGLDSKGFDPVKVQKFVLTEGGPDYLAAIELILVHSDVDAVPITMLGAQCLIHNFALKFLYPKSIRIIAHNDESKTGEDGAKRRCEQLSQSGCKDVRVCRLPPAYGDLNDFLAKSDELAKCRAAQKLYAV
jgi:hypothetical protein